MYKRQVLAIAAEMDWEVRQLDVKTAFLYADIQEDMTVAGHQASRLKARTEFFS